MRKCSQCKVVKNLNNYFNDSSKALGKGYWCKSCSAAHAKKKYSYIKLRPVREYQPKSCSNCKELFSKKQNNSHSQWLKKQFCSKPCMYKGQINKPHPNDRRSMTPEELERRKTLVNFSGKNNPFYGKRHDKETRLKISITKQGVDKESWKGFKGTERHRAMRQKEYILWRTAVFMRDDYTCISCGDKGYVEADHIKPWALYPELRYAIDNGRTLCKPCHQETESYPVSLKGGY